MVVQNMDPDKATELLLMGNAKPVNVCPPNVLYGKSLSGGRRFYGCT